MKAGKRGERGVGRPGGVLNPRVPVPRPRFCQLDCAGREAKKRGAVVGKGCLCC